MFAEAYAGAADRGEFLDRLQILMKGLSIEKKDDGRAIFSYPCCYCDLYNMGYLSSPILCECSRLNLIANFESVMGKGCVEVTLLQSILGGAGPRLEVQFCGNAPAHTVGETRPRRFISRRVISGHERDHLLIHP